MPTFYDAEVVWSGRDRNISYTRDIKLRYEGETYLIELSYDTYGGYEWATEEAIPDGLRELLDEYDLVELEEASDAARGTAA